MMRSLLFRVAAKWAADLHRRVHVGERQGACSFVPAAFLEPYWTDGTADPRRDLQSCVNAFVPAFLKQHPPCAARRAAAILRKRYREHWSAAALAECVAIGRITLVREFHAEFHLSIAAYQRMLRVATACEQLGTNNVEAVALDVGYKSKKNLYHALEKVTGLTPRAFRALSGQEASALTERLRLQLARPHM